jgi:hypothetical protein
VVGVVVPLMLAVLPNARARGFDLYLGQQSAHDTDFMISVDNRQELFNEVSCLKKILIEHFPVHKCRPILN